MRRFQRGFIKIHILVFIARGQDHTRNNIKRNNNLAQCEPRSPVLSAKGLPISKSAVVTKSQQAYEIPYCFSSNTGSFRRGIVTRQRSLIVFHCYCKLFQTWNIMRPANVYKTSHWETKKSRTVDRILLNGKQNTVENPWKILWYHWCVHT